VRLHDTIRQQLNENGTSQKLLHFDVALIYFHGSRSRGSARPGSDYDFAVLLNDRVQWSFLEKVERLDKCAELLAAKLSVERDEIDIQDLEDMPLLMAFNVVGDGALVWEGEANLGLYFRRQIYNRYQDFEWTERFFAKALRSRLLGEKRIG